MAAERGERLAYLGQLPPVRNVPRSATSAGAHSRDVYVCVCVCDDYECVSVSAAVVETLAGWLIRRRRRGGVGILSGSTTETDTF